MNSFKWHLEAMPFYVLDAATRDAVTKVYEWLRCLPEILQGTNQTDVQWLILSARRGDHIKYCKYKKHRLRSFQQYSYLQICDSCIRSYPRVNKGRGSTGTLNVRLGTTINAINVKMLRHIWRCIWFFW